MSDLEIASTFRLPLEVVTESIAILARKRAGKSYLARKLAERLFDAKQQVVVVDPKGDWWGIRAAADGRGPGKPVVILGGEHGDVPLESESGELVGQMIVRERVSVLLDLSSFRKHQVSTFMAAFLETVYRLKAKDEYRTAMMLLIDEADAIAPQRPQHGEERMLGAAEDIVRRGGQRGIGITMVTQRAAVLNKNVLTQASILVTLQTIAPQDLAATDEWIKLHGTPQQRAELMASLPSLPQGVAWWWAPGWPTGAGIFYRVKAEPIETFDSGRTPRPGERRVLPKTMADVDLDAFRRDMAATIERTEASDPKRLRARIAELERAQKQWQKNGIVSPPKEQRVEIIRPMTVHAVTAAIAGLQRLTERTQGLLDKVVPLVKQAEDQRLRLERATTELVVALRLRTAATPAPETQPVTDRGGPIRAYVPRKGVETVGGGQRRMLVALAQRHPRPLSADQLGIRAGLSPRSGTFDTYLGRLRASGWVEGQRSTLSLTAAGQKAVGPYEPLPEGPALIDYWIREVGGGAARMLTVLVDHYPKPMEAEALGLRAGLSASSGTFDTYLGRLRRLELVTGPRHALLASEEFFA